MTKFYLHANWQLPDHLVARFEDLELHQCIDLIWNRL